MKFSTSTKKKKTNWREQAEASEDPEEAGTSEAFQALQRELAENAKAEKIAKREEARRLADQAREDGMARREGGSEEGGGEGSGRRGTENGGETEKRQSEDQSNMVMVTGLSMGTRIHEVKQRMHQFGDVTQLTLFKGKAWVEFGSTRDAVCYNLEGDTQSRPPYFSSLFLCLPIFLVSLAPSPPLPAHQLPHAE